jgi:hypothetical protein
MSPQQPAGIYLGTDFDGMIRGFEQKIEDANQLGSRLSEFLAAAFPQACQQGIALGSALATYLISGYAEHLDALRHQKAVAQPYFRNSPVERLAELVKQRDRYQEQIDNADAMLDKLKGTGAEDVMRIGVETMLNGTRQQLEWHNEQISELQKEMEHTDE